MVNPNKPLPIDTGIRSVPYVSSGSSRLPDWDIWLEMPTLKLRECVALSLNIDPKKLKTDNWGGINEGDIFNKRLMLLERNLDENELLKKLNQIPQRVAWNNEVNPTQFVQYVLSLKNPWPLTPEFMTLLDRVVKPIETKSTEDKSVANPENTQPVPTYKMDDMGTESEPTETETTKNLSAHWKIFAYGIGYQWMTEQRKAGNNVGLDDIATYVRVVFRELNITSTRGEIPDATYIKRHALKGITGRKPNGK